MMEPTTDSSAFQPAGDHSFLKRHEKQFVLLVTIFGALRVFIFNAAFPFFNNVDEVHHFDAVVKYARGYIPQKQNTFYDYESARMITLYGSPEYFYTSSEIKNHGFSPFLWKIPQFVSSSEFNKVVSDRTQIHNIEAFSPPLYYAVMGIWYNLGKWMGLPGEFSLYWIRFSNIIVFVLLLIVTNKFCQLLAPENLSLRYGVILLLAWFPQDVFYSITNDAFSPLLFLLSIFFLWKIYLSEKSFLFYSITGLLIAASILIKLTNVVVVIPMLLILAKKLFGYQRNNNLKEGIYHVSLCLAGALVPIAIWMSANTILIGDPLGASEKVKSLGWTLKPIDQWFHHPFFTFQGIPFFIAGLIKTFWRGEFVWGLQPIASNAADNIYIISTGLFILASVLGVIIRKKSLCSSNRYEYMVLLLSIAGSVFMLGVLSMMYDFGNCWSPSREYPYFTSGRLILAVLIPFLILFVDGLQSVLTLFHWQKAAGWIILVLVVFITMSEISISLPAFLSQYNFFHLF